MDTDDSRDEISVKLEKVLSGFVQRGSRIIRDDVYLEMILTNLSGKNGQNYSEILNSPFLFEFIKKAHSQMTTELHNTQTYAFSLRLLALLVENERRFMSIMDTDILTSMNHDIKSDQKLRTASVKLAHVKVLQAMHQHSVGTYWLINSKSWQLVIEYCMENQTVYVVRESQSFITNFLFKIASTLHDDELSTEILMEIVAPLSDAIVIIDGTVNVDSSDLQRKVNPRIDLVCHIMEHCVRSETKTNIPQQLLNKSINVRMVLWRLTDMTKDQMFFRNIMRALVVMNVAEFSDKLSDNTATTLTHNQFGLNFYNQMKFCMVHRSPLTLLACAQQYHLLWASLGNRVPEEIELETNKIKFENQIIVLQMMPILICIKKEKKHGGVVADLFDNYIMKLFDISIAHTLRVCYSLRELLSTNKAIVSDVATKSIQGILAMKNVLNRDRAVFVFQALCYSLKDFVFHCEPDTTNINTDNLIEMPNLLSAILTGLHAMVKEYRITWKESIETVCLMKFMLLLLNKPNLSMRLSVQALQLTQLTVEHFLAPNLALLVDDVKGSSLECLGPTVMKRLHDSNWEVRDSTLELVTAISTISIFKFPAFQQLILENGICPVIVNLAKNDAEAFVRASALNCLCPMVNVKVLWEQCLSSMDLMEHLLKVVRNESEGIVRKAAVCLICEIYKKYTIPNHQYDLLFPTLAYSAVSDLYWDVKFEALLFWKTVIKRQFQHNGVIDGAFPAVTFSKELKKIVTLTPKEIETRLNRILDELSTRGALGVLLECLNDNCDLQVVKRAARMVATISMFLNSYNYMPELIHPEPTATGHHHSGSAGSSLDSTALLDEEMAPRAPPDATSIAFDSHSDNIIESIVSLDDINLLVHAYENQMKLDVEPVEHSGNAIDDEGFQKLVNVKPIDYLRRIGSIDIEAMIESRVGWISKNESFDSLLDDIMFSLEIADINEADCY